MTTAPQLPIELHAEIIGSLHHYRDRPTLLSLSLVNKEWSKESQRVLYSKMTDRQYGTAEYDDRVLLTHMGFLQTIVKHPHSLGPLVRSYAQHELAFNPEAMRNEQYMKSGSALWKLTEQALAVMINLKHLYLAPSADSNPADDDWISSRALLSIFTFQLETCTWKSYHHVDNGFPEFLATQHKIVHVEHGNFPGRNQVDLTWLGDGFCTNLSSMSCCFNSLNHVIRSKKIVAWKWYPGDNETALVERDPSPLVPLKYLSVYNYNHFRSIIGPPFDMNIILLEVGEASWGANTFETLSHFPRLRVLSLCQSAYHPVNSQEVTRIAISCFKQLPSLEYIVQRDHRKDGERYSYLKLTIHPDSTESILREELMMDYDLAAPWWTVYNV